MTRTLIGWRGTGERKKQGCDPILLRNGCYGATAGGNGNGATEFFTYAT